MGEEARGNALGQGLDELERPLGRDGAHGIGEDVIGEDMPHVVAIGRGAADIGGNVELTRCGWPRSCE